MIILAIYVTFNLLYLKFSSKKPAITKGPLISILVPARNEEKNIEGCLRSLVNQTYENYEIIVLDDNSTDDTYEIALYFEKKYTNVKVINGLPKKSDWLGKAFAMQQLASHAKGEYLFFTDADTLHDKESIAWATTNSIIHEVDALSGFTQCKMKSFGEQLVLPIVFLPIKMFFPLWLVKHSKNSLFSIAIGQFYMFKKETFLAIGGYEAVKDKITEDVYMARHLKDQGYKIIFMDGSHYISHRSYEGFSSSVSSITKNVVDTVGNKYFLLLPVLAFYFFIYILPSFIWINSFLYSGEHFIQLTSILLLSLYITSSILNNHGFKIFTILIFPVLYAVAIYTVLKSISDKIFGKSIEWKGRIVNEN